MGGECVDGHMGAWAREWGVGAWVHGAWVWRMGTWVAHGCMGGAGVHGHMGAALVAHGWCVSARVYRCKCKRNAKH